MTENDYKDQINDATAQPLPICVGIVHSITPVPSRYDHSFKIEMDCSTWYYYNGKTDSVVYKLFKPGKKAAFSYREKKSGERVFKIVESVFMTF